MFSWSRAPRLSGSRALLSFHSGSRSGRFRFALRAVHASIVGSSTKKQRGDEQVAFAVAAVLFAYAANAPASVP